MADDDEQVRLLQDRVSKPLLLECISNGLHDGIVGVAGKVEEEAKREDVEALVLRLEAAEALRLRYPLAGLGVDVVQVGRDVVVLEIGDGGVVLAVGRVALVELMVAGADDVDLLLGVDVVLEEALGRGGVVQAVALDAIARVDEEEVGARLVGALVEMVREGDVVAPVGRVLRSAEVSESTEGNWRYDSLL